MIHISNSTNIIMGSSFGFIFGIQYHLLFIPILFNIHSCITTKTETSKGAELSCKWDYTILFWFWILLWKYLHFMGISTFSRYYPHLWKYPHSVDIIRILWIYPHFMDTIRISWLLSSLATLSANYLLMFFVLFTVSFWLWILCLVTLQDT